MPRIPYLPEDITEPKELVDSIRARRARRGWTLNEADLTVLHAPRLARAWNEIGLAVWQEFGLPVKLRELAIIGVGMLNDSAFEVVKHTPAFLEGGGTEAQLKALDNYELAAENPQLFDDLERAIMRLTIEMTRNIKVSDATFNEVQHRLESNEATVEMVGTIAIYNMVSRFLIALQVGED